MGDVVFAPFYEVLKRRGVRFEFFHRLENVRLGPTPPASRRTSRRWSFDVQAEIEGGGEYRPLVDVRGLPCWPSEPDWQQLVGGARHEARRAGSFESHWDRRQGAARKTLRGRRATSISSCSASASARVPHVCRELIARDPRWRTMVDQVKIVSRPRRSRSG